MALPAANTVWPPTQMQPVYSKMAEWAAWYSGEPSRILDVYSTQAANPTGPVPWWRFWHRARAGTDGGQRAQLHVPLASDLAAVSGSLLFGEPPRVRVRPARAEDGPGATPEASPSKGKRRSPEQRSEARLLDIMDKGAVNSRLVEAAETAAAMGGVYIYPVWDEDLRDFPLMAIAQADQAVPEFRYGLLTAVTFARVVSDPNSGEILRHLERHEVQGSGADRKAVVLHGLYRGSSTMLGAPVDLVASEATAALPARVELPFQELDVEYVPNIRPNRLWRASGHGVADIQGSETLLDALDETYASWMRDVRLAKARIIVPREYLTTDPDGKAGFDVDQEIYVGMDMDPGLTQDARAMLAHQFNIRWMEHKGTSEAIIDRIVSNAGYATSTLGAQQAASAATSSLRIGEHKTILTLKRKSAWWEAAVANVLYRMMLIDRDVFGGTAPAIRPIVTLADSIIDTPLELAQTALALSTAASASIETRVRLQHPDWSEAEVDAEVLRIKDELEAAKPPVAVSSGAFGGKGTDAASTSKLPTTGKGDAPANDPPTTPPQAKNAG